MSKIVERIEREAGIPGLVSILAERLAPTDLQSILLEVYRHRSSQRKPSDLLTDYQRDRFVRPSSLAPAELLKWEQVAFAHLPQEFQFRFTWPPATASCAPSVLNAQARYPISALLHCAAPVEIRAICNSSWLN
jgi:hypothetical protein